MPFIRFLALLLSVVGLALARDALLSHAMFIGLDTTKYPIPAVDIYRNRRNHATAAASILSFAAERSGYVPYEQGPLQACENYGHFLQELKDFPGLNLLETGERRVFVKSRANLEQAIEGTYPFEEAAEVAHLLGGMADTAARRDNRSQEMHWVLSLIVLRKPPPRRDSTRNADVTVLLVDIQLHFDSQNRREIPEQEITVTLTYMHVVEGILVRHAETFADLVPTTCIQEFERLMTSTLSLTAFQNS